MIKLATRCKIPFILNNNTNLTCKSLQSIVSTKLARSLAFYFAKLKKEKPQLKVPTINISKFSQQDDGFVLYNNDQGGRFKTVSIAFLVYFLWGAWMYKQTEDEEIKVNYLVLGAMVFASFLIYQLRVRKTLKKMILDKQG